MDNVDIYIAIDNKEKEKFITKAEDIKQELEKINNPVRYIDNVVDLQDTLFVNGYERKDYT